MKNNVQFVYIGLFIVIDSSVCYPRVSLCMKDQVSQFYLKP